jgi:hypothetical protein
VVNRRFAHIKALTELPEQGLKGILE